MFEKLKSAAGRAAGRIGRGRVFLINRGWMVATALVLSIAAITMIFGNENIVGAAAARRELPIYSVQREDKVASLTFDAAWGNAKLRTLTRGNKIIRFFRKIVHYILVDICLIFLYNL